MRKRENGHLSCQREAFTVRSSAVSMPGPLPERGFLCGFGHHCSIPSETEIFGFDFLEEMRELRSDLGPEFEILSTFPHLSQLSHLNLIQQLFLETHFY